MRSYLRLAVTLILALAPIARADEPAAEGKTYVLLVAVSKHADRRLDRGVENTVRDAELLRTTLQQRAGIPADQFLELTSQTDADRKPIAVPSFCSVDTMPNRDQFQQAGPM